MALCLVVLLLETLNDWTSTINIKKSVAVAYKDFKRAFDGVSPGV